MILDKHCGNLIKQIHDGMQKSANNDLRGRGLTVTQLNLLLSLYDGPDGELSLKQLEQIMHVAQSTTRRSSRGWSRSRCWKAFRIRRISGSSLSVSLKPENSAALKWRRR